MPLKLGEFLIKANLITEKQLETALADQHETGGRIGEHLLRLGFVTEEGSRQELYNLPRDRAEQNDLADQHPDLVEKLSLKVLTWKKTLPEEPAGHCISALRK